MMRAFSASVTTAIIAQLFVAGYTSTTTASEESRPQLQSIVPPSQSSVPGLPKIKVVDRRTSSNIQHFVRFGQCQIQISPTGLNSRGVWEAREPDKLIADLGACLSTAVSERVDVLVLPELALTLPQSEREQFLNQVSDAAKSQDMIIVAGSYYDEERYSRLVVVGPTWVELGYKVRPSRFEVSPRDGEGMKPGTEILVLQTDFGNFAVITCVDLISDEVQFQVRRLATRGKIDVLININHNPAAWEFLIEANSIVRRHPLFASITNVYSPAKKPGEDCSDGNDTGYCYGHTAVFASLRTEPGERPNSSKQILDMLPDPVVLRDQDNIAVKRNIPYSNVVGDVGPSREALLVYELNMWLKRVPDATNAPDQGYPPIRGLKIVDLLRP